MPYVYKVISCLKVALQYIVLDTGSGLTLMDIAVSDIGFLRAVQCIVRLLAASVIKHIDCFKGLMLFNWIWC